MVDGTRPVTESQLELDSCRWAATIKIPSGREQGCFRRVYIDQLRSCAVRGRSICLVWRPLLWPRPAGPARRESYIPPLTSGRGRKITITAVTIAIDNILEHSLCIMHKNNLMMFPHFTQYMYVHRRRTKYILDCFHLVITHKLLQLSMRLFFTIIIRII